MNPISTIMTATRLTRAGRLAEAMALLRGVSPTPAAPEGDALEPTTPMRLSELYRQRPSARAKAFRALRDRASSPLCGMTMPFRPSAPAVPVPEGASFAERRFSNSAGTRAYKLYVPSTYKGQSVPLVVMLHGCTQSPDDFATGTRMNELAEQHALLVAYPAQNPSANAQKCWNWFQAGDQRRGRGEPSLISGVTREIMREFPVDPARVFIAGLSAGGAAAAIMGSEYPELYAAIGVHSRLAPGAASDVQSAFAAMRNGAAGGRRGRSGSHPLAAIVFHGDADPTVNAINGDQIIAAAQGDATLGGT